MRKEWSVVGARVETLVQLYRGSLLQYVMICVCVGRDSTVSVFLTLRFEPPKKAGSFSVYSVTVKP